MAFYLALRNWLCDLDLWPLTSSPELTSELCNLDEVFRAVRSRIRTATGQTDRQIDKQTDMVQPVIGLHGGVPIIIKTKHRVAPSAVSWFSLESATENCCEQTLAVSFKNPGQKNPPETQWMQSGPKLVNDQIIQSYILSYSWYLRLTAFHGVIGFQARPAWTKMTDTYTYRTSYRAARRYTPTNRGGSTSVRRRIRSPQALVALPRRCAPSWPKWDRQTDRQTDRRIAASINAPYGGGIIILKWQECTKTQMDTAKA